VDGGRSRGWHDDPSGRHELRWYDGSHWTTAVKDRGQQSRDDIQPASVATRGGSEFWSGVEPGTRRKGPKRPSKSYAFVGAIALAVLVLGVGAWAVFLRDDGGGSEEPAGPDFSEASGEDFTITTTAPSESCFADAGFGQMSGDITNDTDEIRSYEVLVDFASRGGDPLGESSTIVQDLQPGTSKQWTATVPLEPQELRCDVTINNFPTSS
jgi:hypothetical protein